MYFTFAPPPVIKSKRTKNFLFLRIINFIPENASDRASKFPITKFSPRHIPDVIQRTFDIINATR